MSRQVISLRDLQDSDIDWILRRGAEIARDRSSWGEPLRDKVIGVYFSKTSTRTRTSFTTGALRLGARLIAYGPGDLQLNTGESLEDTARVLGSMLDGLVIRTAGPVAEMRTFAEYCGTVVNAMSADEHPTQALADLTTLRAHFGRIEGLKLLYAGEGNNTAAALALALSRFPGVEVEFRTPKGYGLADSVLAEARSLAAECGSKVEEYHDMESLPPAVDVVYTTRWQTTGTSKRDPKWRRDFEPFQVNAGVMTRYPKAIFMHDLPAHRGDEVTAEVLDGPSSIAFEQALNKLHSAMATLEWCLGR